MIEKYPNIIAGRKWRYFLVVGGKTVAEFPSAELARQRSLEVAEAASGVEVHHVQDRHAAAYLEELKDEMD